MLLKQSGEHSSPDFINLKFELGAALKAVPIVKPGLLHIIYPIRLQPFDNIVVAGKQDNLPITFRHVFAKAAAPTLAICRSITEVNSSTTARLGRSHTRRARPARNFSPLLKTGNGRSHAGTSPRPTADNAPVTALKSPSGAMQSTIGFVASHPAYKS